MKRTLPAATLAVALAACTGTGAPHPPDDSVPVVRILDGDSLVVEINGAETDVRLLGINTPERDECFDAEAKARTTELAADGVRLVGSDEDRFGRLLRYAYTQEGTLINQQLVTEGFALALSTGHSLREEFKAAEAEAFRERLGRWSPTACGPAGDTAIVISRLEYDAPGDDAGNANGEWVDITNTDADTAVLDGWAIQDESSSHRFVFPDGFSIPPGGEVRVFSGCGQPTGDHLFWCDQDPVWSNGGDTAYLLDPAGNVVDRWAF